MIDPEYLQVCRMVTEACGPAMIVKRRVCGITRSLRVYIVEPLISQGSSWSFDSEFFRGSPLLLRDMLKSLWVKSNAL